MTEADYKKADMPPHCGNCVFARWDDDYSYCTNLWRLDDDDIHAGYERRKRYQQRNEDRPADDSFPCRLLEDLHTHNMDIQGGFSYDHVCRHHTPEIGSWKERNEFLTRYDAEMLEMVRLKVEEFKEKDNDVNKS